MAAHSTLRKPASACKPAKKSKAMASPATPTRPGGEEGLPGEGTGAQAGLPGEGTGAQAGLPGEGTVAQAGLPGSVKVEMVSPQRPSPHSKAAPKAAPKASGPKPSAPKLPPIPKDQAKKMNYQLKALAQKGHSDLAQQFAACGTQQEKRQFFYNVYCLDPRVSTKKVEKKDVEEAKEIEDEQEGWFTAETIAEWKGIKPGCSNYEAKVKASVEGLPERDHETKSLAKLGVKQYEYTHKSKSTTVTKKRKLAITEGVDDVSQEDFAQMRAAMHKGMEQKMISSSSSKPNKGGLNKAQAEAEASLDVDIDWCQNYKDQHKKCKSLVAQVAAEVHTLEVFKGKVESMGDSDLKGPVLKQLEAMATELEKKKKTFLAQHLKFPQHIDDPAEAENKSPEITNFNTDVADFMKQIKKELQKHKKFLEG